MPMMTGEQYRASLIDGRKCYIDGDLIEDPSVSGAQRLLGDFDYRLSTFHPCWREAAAWTRALRNRPEVLTVKDVNVRPLFGDDLPGLVLRGAPPRGQRNA